MPLNLVTLIHQGLLTSFGVLVDKIEAISTGQPYPAPTANFTQGNLRGEPTNDLFSSSCGVPKLVGEWENFVVYPMPIAEAQGTIIGDDLIVISGFTGGYDMATNKNYAINLRDEKPAWRQIADLPIKDGVTHGAFALVGSKLYMCGGYLGGHPGPHIADCLIYDHEKDEWTEFEPLPEGRAGGGLVYSSEAQALIFAAGAERPDPTTPNAVDYQHTWMYNFKKPNAGWVEKDDIPYLTNHMSYTTTFDQAGKEHQMFFAGQVGENEFTGNVDDNFEWDVAKEEWIRKEAMPFTRGHASSSTSAVNCGLLVAGGSSNEFGMTDDISFYDVPSNKWTSVGSLPAAINTPVCAIHHDDGWYYCVTGWADGLFSSRIKIEF